MSQQFIRETEDAIDLSVESPYGTDGSFKRIVHIVNSFNDKRSTQQIDVNDASLELYDQKTSLDGLKSENSGADWQSYLKVNSAQLDHTATGTALDTPPNMLFAKNVLGGETVAAGSLVVASPAPTTTGFSVTPASGTNFLAPGGILVEVGTPGSGTFECVPIDSVSTDALTLALALSNAPGTGAKVYNMFNWWPDPGNTISMSMRRGLGADANEQYKWNGGTGDFELTYDRGQALMMKCSLRSATWSGPLSSIFGSLPTYSADTQVGPFALKDAVTLVQPPATTSKATNWQISGLKLAFKPGMMFQKEHGGIEGTTNVQRLGGRDFAELTVEGPWDRTILTYARTPKTQLRFWHFVPQGSGTTLRGMGLHMPRCFIYGEPEAFSQGGQRMIRMKLRSQIDASLSTKFLKAPFVIFGG